MTRLCALYGVTPAGYYAWRRRPASAHTEQDRQLTQRITTIYRAHGGRYGSPRIHEELAQAGCRVSRRRVARLMRAAGLRARVVRVYRANPRLHRFYGQHPNRLPATGARRPDQVWVGDITYLPVGRGRWRFLAVVLDQYSRRVLAWTLRRQRTARVTGAVLEAAVRRRRPRPGLIFHSDRGSEYVAAALRDRLRALGIPPTTPTWSPSGIRSRPSCCTGRGSPPTRRSAAPSVATCTTTTTGVSTPRWATARQLTMRPMPRNHCQRNRGKIPGAQMAERPERRLAPTRPRRKH